MRETLGEVREAGDSFALLGEIMERIDADIDQLVSELRQQLGSGAAADLQQAADCLTRMQFFRKLQDEAMELEVELEDELA